MQISSVYVFAIVFAFLLIWKLGKTILLCGVLAAMATLAFSYWKTGSMPDLVTTLYAKVFSSLPSKEQVSTFESNVLKDLKVLQGPTNVPSATT